MNVSDVIISQLEKEGVRWIFGVPGEENIDFLEAVERSSIEFIVAKHEQTAAMMAGMVGKLSGTVGVCLSTLGPGATNMLTGVANATADAFPLIAISGQTHTNKMHQEAHQYIDLVSLFKPVTKKSETIREPETAQEIVQSAIQTAKAEKPGAVFLELPENVAELEVTRMAEDRPPIQATVQADDHTIQSVVEQINKAERPLVLVGNGVIRDHAHQEMITFAEAFQAPVVETFMGKGAVQWSHPLHVMSVGMKGEDIVDQALLHADLIVTVGYDYIEYPPAKWNKKATPIVHIHHDSPAIDKHYPVVATIMGSLKQNLKRIGLITDQNKKNIDETFKQTRQAIRSEWEQAQHNQSYPLTPSKILYELRDALPEDGIVISDVGAHKLWLGRMFPVHQPHTCFISNGLATMGTALPQAIGAQLVHPSRPIVAVCGDGGFQMNVQELETAVRLQLPIIIMVWRDGGYGLIEWEQYTKHHHAHHISFQNPDLIDLAHAYGLEALRIDKALDLKPMLLQAIKMKKPVLIDCPVQYQIEGKE
ncbi:acetolactate synthase large subunit [Hazenella sp. IB182357]|uniref:Acetolactate synthase large subunit n=1 Tax=Polycladospora coralii TaxID=2771432 RepID=A0A926NDP4_9BACL|nr:acetolactate synthase large subunit [Polycladospora coralii]MBD1371553.1 acetolactate synthase large subunit [Polycladospora coralii]